jgi:Ser/Thr protein kinase RdoA (MazF antagonist)
MMDAALLQLLSEQYALSGVQFQQRLATKGTRQALVLATDQGRFVLKITDHTRPEAVVQTDLATLDLLAQAGFPAPRLLLTRGGQRYVPYQSSFLYLYHYIEGRQPGPSSAFFTRLGELLARLHSIPVTAGMPRSQWSPAGTIPEIVSALRKVETLQDRRMAQEALTALEDFPSMAGLPEGLVHSDPWYGNLLEDASGSLYLVDWDDAGVAYPLLDVAYVLTYLCTQLPSEQPEGASEVAWRAEWAKIFLTSYQAIRPLSRAEQRLLPAAVRLTALVYLPHWESNQVIEDNYHRWKLLEVVFGLDIHS